MTQLTRRKLFAGVAAAGAATALTPFLVRNAFAATPAAGKQAAAFYRYKVGSYECTSINDGSRSFPMPDTFVKNVPKDQALAAAEAAYMPKGMVTVPFNPQIINTGSKLVLIDTGYGPGIAPSVGLLPAGMAAAGIDPKAIDVVVLSHLHPDHINGLKTADGKVAFPNAEIMAPSQDWAFWMNDENAAKAESNPMMKGYFGNTRKILSDVAGKVTKYDWGKEVAPRHHRARNARPHAGTHLVRGGLGLLEDPDPVRRHQHSGVFSAQSGLARGLRRRPGQSRRDAPQILRHGGGRKGDGGRLPLPVPVHRLCGEGGHRLPADPGCVESHDLSASGNDCWRKPPKGGFLFYP